MAALRPCPFLTTAPVFFNLDRSQPRTCGIILPLDRSSSTLKITRAPPDRSSTLLKSNHGIRAHRGAAGEPAGPDPEGLMRTYMSPEEKKIWDECKIVAKGPPIDQEVSVATITRYGSNEAPSSSLMFV